MKLLVTVTVKVPRTYVEMLDELVRMGRYSNRSEAVRAAIRELLASELPSAATIAAPRDVLAEA